MIWVSLSAIAGRFFCSWISDAMGRRASGVLSCLFAAVFMSLAGYLHNVFIGGVSMFFVMILLQNFFGSGNYSIVGPYMGELWPARLRGSGMGLVYGVGNLGKFIGPAGLALIAGSSNFVAPKATLDALIPGVQLFRLLVCAGGGRLLVHRHRDERPHDRGDRCRTGWDSPGSIVVADRHAVRSAVLIATGEETGIGRMLTPGGASGLPVVSTGALSHCLINRSTAGHGPLGGRAAGRPAGWSKIGVVKATGRAKPQTCSVTQP